MKDVLELIATYGLPIVLTIWFVFRIDTAITSLVTLLQSFISSMKEKDTDRKEGDKDIREALRVISEHCVEVNNRIKILEVKIDK